jgi:hypothetical protein
MKKNVLALSITAALIGLTGNASAMTGALDGADATTLRLSPGGIGHMLVVPYFTAQDTNATLINLVNTDTVNGKAVKVRFRGAANSDDIYDFQVFMSPGDVWTANVSKGADGRAKLTTNDASCTKPSKAVLNATPFVTARLDSTMTADQKANGTREGYVEIFNMGDIPKGIAGAAVVADVDTTQTTAGYSATAGATVNPLYTAIKHVSKVAPCSGTAWDYLDTSNLEWSDLGAAATTPRSAGLLPPTTGLMANWTIINLANAAAWTGNAVAIQAVATALDANGYDVPAKGRVVYWPQTGSAVGFAVGSTINDYSADPLLRTAQVASYTGAAYAADTSAAVAAGYYDLPDLSTPYVTSGLAVGLQPLEQAANVTDALAASSVTNELLTDTTIQGSTDWVFSMPTRRYSVAFDYAATISGTDDGRRFSDIVNRDGTFAAGYFLASNTLVSSSTNGNGRQICTKGITTTPYDREETGVATSTTVVVSPSTPADPLSFCGEATVLSINNGGILATGTSALKASVAVKDLDVTFIDGWMKISTPSATAVTNSVTGLPMLGASFSRAAAGAQGFGVSNAHRFGR